MCILMYFTPGTLPVRDHLVNGCCNNPDGFGWAIVTYTDGILTGHSMDADEAIDQFIEVRNMFPEQSAIFHARIATHGSVRIENTHPFEVKQRWLRTRGSHVVEGEMYLAHNGILPCQPMKGDDRSDTRILAEDVLMKRFPHLDSQKTKNRLDNYLKACGSKIVILTTDPAYQQQSYIFNESAGDWSDDQDAWYSNTSWKPRSYTTWTWPTTVGYARSREYVESWDTADDPTERYAGYRLACVECKYAVLFCTCELPTKSAFLPAYQVLVPGQETVDEDDESSDWVCTGCHGVGTIDADAKCKLCDVMYCCDQPYVSCQCWDPASGKLDVNRALDSRKKSTDLELWNADLHAL